MNKVGKWMLLVILAMTLGGLSVTPAVAQGDPQDCGCVRSPGYWKNHLPDGVGNRLLMGADPDITWEQALNSPPRGSLYLILARQYVAAMLNIEAGTECTCSTCICTSTAEAAGYLATWPGWWEKVPSSREHVEFLVNWLDQFNNGLGAVPACSD